MVESSSKATGDDLYIYFRNLERKLWKIFSSYPYRYGEGHLSEPMLLEAYFWARSVDSVPELMWKIFDWCSSDRPWAADLITTVSRVTEDIFTVEWWSSLIRYLMNHGEPDSVISALLAVDYIRTPALLTLISGYPDSHPVLRDMIYHILLGGHGESVRENIMGGGDARA